jgi:hypothetical protein
MTLQKLVSTDFEIKKLDETDDLSVFDCSENDDLGLDEFLHDQAQMYQNEKMGITYLFYKGNQIAGYITVAMGSINVKKTEVDIPDFEKRRYPALLLGRVGVHNSFRRRSVGKCMCLWCVGLAQQLSFELGCRFIVLATQGESRVKFYKECGFREAKVSKKEADFSEDSHLMYFEL